MTFKNWLIFLLVSNFGFVLAQTADTNYPTKPIRIIIPQSSGSATDSLIRLIAPKLTEQLGQSLILENRLGAGGIIGADTVAKAAPDDKASPSNTPVTTGASLNTRDFMICPFC